MFGPDIFGALIGFGLALLLAPILLVLQMQSPDQRLNWREPLVFSFAIAAAAAVVVAIGGIFNGDGGDAFRLAAGLSVPMFFLIAAGSLVGRGAGWVLQRLRDRL